jgi:hypothetical protein
MNREVPHAAALSRRNLRRVMMACFIGFFAN